MQRPSRLPLRLTYLLTDLLEGLDAAIAVPASGAGKRPVQVPFGRDMRQGGKLQRGQEVVAATLEELLTHLPIRPMEGDAAQSLAADLLTLDAPMAYARTSCVVGGDLGDSAVVATPLLPSSRLAASPQEKLPLGERPHRLYRQSSKRVSELLAYRISRAEESLRANFARRKKS